MSITFVLKEDYRGASGHAGRIAVVRADGNGFLVKEIGGAGELKESVMPLDTFHRCYEVEPLQ